MNNSANDRLPITRYPGSEWGIDLPPNFAGWVLLAIVSDSSEAGYAGFKVRGAGRELQTPDVPISPNQVTILRYEHTDDRLIWLENRGETPFKLMEVVLVEPDPQAIETQRDYDAMRVLKKKWQQSMSLE